MSDFPIRIGYVCPTYKQLELRDYTLRTLTSFFQHTAHGVAVVVDDASEGWDGSIEDELQATCRYPGQEIHFYHFSKWGGLTRSWNRGLAMLRQIGVNYAVSGNNDVLFTPSWYEGLLHALENGYSLVGPLSNAPGVTSKGLAEVWRYLPRYETTDDPQVLAEQAAYLRQRYLGRVESTKVNGFFHMAKMQTWIEGMYDKELFYCPCNTHTSRGQPNPTPLMTLNEDELQRRWYARGWKSAVVLSSFIFHYRAVTRGDRYRKGRWHRIGDSQQGA